MKYSYQSFYLDYPLVVGRVFDVFMPEIVSKDVSVFWVHGGAWRGGRRDEFHKIMQALNDRGYIVASTDYRLDAKDAFEQLRDIRASYDRFVSFLKEKNIPLNIAVYGVSAGAHLASLMTCTEPGGCGEENDILSNSWVKPCMAVFQSTPYDFLPWEGMMPQFWNIMQDIAGARYDEEPERFECLSLKNYINKTNPPMFFMEAEFENLFPSEYTKKIAEQHRKWGIKSHWKKYKRMEHGFFYELTRKAQLEALEDFCLFLDGNLETL